jgi:hypothetical protein
MTADMEHKGGAGPGTEPPTLQFLVLKWAVIGMGILLVAGFAVIVVTIVNRSQGFGKNEAGLASGTASGESGAAIDLPVPRGANVTALDLDGSRLAITLKSPSGSEIAIIHLKSGRVIRRIKLQEN